MSLLMRYVDDPRSGREVGGLLFRVAVVFSSVWLVAFDLLSGGLGSEFGGWVAVCVICVLNAGFVGGWLWQRLVERRSQALTKRYGTAAGAAVGIVTYVTAGIAVAAFLLGLMILEPGVMSVPGLAPSLGSLAAFSLFAIVYAVVLTLGVPFLLSVAVGYAAGAAAEADRSDSS